MGPPGPQLRSKDHRAKGPQLRLKRLPPELHEGPTRLGHGFARQKLQGQPKIREPEVRFGHL